MPNTVHAKKKIKSKHLTLRLKQAKKVFAASIINS